MFEYPCPDCGTTINVHERGCEHDEVSIMAIRKAYTDVLSTLLAENSKNVAHDVPPGVSFSRLRERVNDQLQSQPADNRGLWRDLHTTVLHELKNRGRVDETEEMGGLYLKSPEERSYDIIPTFDPMQTIYEYGPVDGAKDYAVYSMVSWCELVGLTWEQTQNFCHEWLTETESWSDLNWGESSIRQLIDSKQHVHERGLGWGEYAGIAAGHIRTSSRADSKGIDARAKAGSVQQADYDNEHYDRT